MAALETKTYHEIRYYLMTSVCQGINALKKQIKLGESWVPLKIMAKCTD
jgi:hypothetical protein